MNDKPDGYCAFRDGKLVIGEYEGVCNRYRHEWDSLKERSPELEIKPVRILDMKEWERLKADRITINRIAGALMDNDIESVRQIVGAALAPIIKEELDAIGKGEG